MYKYYRKAFRNNHFLELRGLMEIKRYKKTNAFTRKRHFKSCYDLNSLIALPPIILSYTWTSFVQLSHTGYKRYRKSSNYFWTLLFLFLWRLHQNKQLSLFLLVYHFLSKFPDWKAFFTTEDKKRNYMLKFHESIMMIYNKIFIMKQSTETKIFPAEVLFVFAIYYQLGHKDYFYNSDVKFF